MHLFPGRRTAITAILQNKTKFFYLWEYNGKSAGHIFLPRLVPCHPRIFPTPQQLPAGPARLFFPLFLISKMRLTARSLKGRNLSLNSICGQDNYPPLLTTAAQSKISPDGYILTPCLSAPTIFSYAINIIGFKSSLDR